MRKAAVEHGAHGYFVKPIGSTELYLAVVNAIRRRGLELEYQANLRRLEAMVAERAEQMQNAAHVQEGMLPRSPLDGEGFEVAAHFTPAREISGDFYDWYLPDANRIAVTLGDVMGKGLPAAMMMATVRAALRASAQVEDLEQSVRLAARIMEAPLEANQKPGDTLLVFSDGLLDLRPDMAVKDVLLPADVRRSATAQELVDNLTQGVRGHEMSDDVTVLALRRKWNPTA